MIIHDKLICPQCAGNGEQLTPSFNGKDVLCSKCGTRTPLTKLRCKVEPSHNIPTMKRTPLGGYYRSVDMTQSEKEALEKHLKALRGKHVNINKPGLVRMKFSHYVKDGSYKRHAKEMSEVKI